MKKTLIFLFLSLISIYTTIPVNGQITASDAVYHHLTKEYTLNTDGSTTYRYIKVLELLTYRSFHSLYGETFIPYNPAFQKLTVNTSYTTMADGKKVITPENALNEVLPSFASNAPAFNGIREMVITHTGLERNATIHLDYEIQSKAPLFEGFNGTEYLAETDPVEEWFLKIRVPIGKGLNHETIGMVLLPIKTTEGPYDVYTWKMNNLPVVTPEEYQATGWKGYPRICFSTAAPEEVLKKLVAQNAFLFESTPAIDNAIGMLNRTNKLLLALDLQKIVVDEIRLYPVPMKYSGGISRTPGEIWRSNGGTQCEKAVLLTTMLRRAGLEARPVAIAGKPFEILEFAVEVIPKPYSRVFLSVNQLNNQDLLRTQSEKEFYSLDPNDVKSIITTGEPSGKISVRGTFLVSSDPVLTGTLTIQANGAFNPFLALVKDTAYLGKMISGSIPFSGLKERKRAEIGDLRSEQTWIVSADKPFRKDSGYLYFPLPVMKEGIDGWGIKYLSWKRITPIIIPFYGEEDNEFELTLPSGIKLFSPERRIKIKNRAGSFQYSVRQSGGKVFISRKINFGQLVYGNSGVTGMYQEFKELMDGWNNPHNREIIFILE